MATREPESPSESELSRRGVLGAALGSALAVLRHWWHEAPLQAGLPAAPEHVTPQTQAAIAGGLNWLASRQVADGGFGSRGSYARNVGVCLSWKK